MLDYLLDIPYILIGRNRRIRESDLQAWIEANMVNYGFPFQLNFFEAPKDDSISIK
jgi:ribosome biogenesis protein Tsr3